MAKKLRAKMKRGPSLAVAVFCENVLQEKDGSLSPIRLIDQIVMRIPASFPVDFPSERNKLPIELRGLLSFKTGDFPGEHKVRIVMESPSGKVSTVHEQTIPFTDPAHGGGNLILQMTIKVYKGGLFWFNVYLDDHLITNMPIKITVVREPSAGTSTPTPGKSYSLQSGSMLPK